MIVFSVVPRMRFIDPGASSTLDAPPPPPWEAQRPPGVELPSRSCLSAAALVWICVAER